jgi:Cof subfamily protein (haloacid dehalogenase superfamily)
MVEPLPNWDTHDVESLRRFSRIRLIALDLDGTLFQASTFELYKKIQDLCHTLSHHRYQVGVTLATGRTLMGVSPLLGKLSLPKGMPLILYNGSVVVRNKNFDIISQRTISTESLRTVLEISSIYRVRTLAYIYNDPMSPFLLPDTHEYVLGWSTIECPEREFNGMRVRWQNAHTAEENLMPSAILIDTSEDPKAAPIIEAEFAKVDNISSTRSGSFYIEIRPNGSNKGIAFESVARFLGLSRDEILGLGDNDNDSEMLSSAGIGVAIAEASPAALASSDYVCRHGVAEGAIEVLRLVRNARRYFFQPSKNLQGVR